MEVSFVGVVGSLQAGAAVAVAAMVVAVGLVITAGFVVAIIMLV